MKSLPLVILHGWNLSARKFTPLVNEFKNKGFQVYCFDLPGFGKSPLPEEPLTLSHYVAYVETYLKKHKLKEVILVGHSFGGRVGIKLASRKPSYLHSLVLTGAPGIVPVPALKIKLFLIAAKGGNLFFSLPIISKVKTTARQFLYRVAKATDFYNTNEKMRQTFKNIVKENLKPYLKQITVPTLLLWGKEDRIVPVDIAQQMNQLIKNSTIVIVEGARHGLPWTHPKIFADKVLEFTKSYDQ